MKKTNTTAVGLHLVAGSSDGILTYSDNIADTEYEHLDRPTTTRGALQSEINKELTKAIKDLDDWHEE